MTSRRKAKRVNWYEPAENCFVQNEDGTLRPFCWPRRWYEKPKDLDRQYRAYWHEPEPMMGCVKKSIQQKRRGSWNLIGLDPWYGKGYISWKRD